MTPPHRVDPTEARRLYASGLSGAAIGRRYSVSKQAVSKWVKRWRQEAGQAATASPPPAPAVASTPTPPPRAEDALLATLQAVKPGLAAMLSAHTRLVDRGSAWYAYVKADPASREAGKRLMQHRDTLEAILGKPIMIAWQ